MSLDHSLIHLLVCPVCKGPLQMGRDEDLHPRELICPADRLGFPIRDGIPVMLENEARALTESEVEAVREARKRPPPPGAGG